MSGVPMRELYVYYRVRRVDAGPYRQAMDRLRDGLVGALPGLELRVLQRDDPAAPADHDTWMEIHRCPPQGIEPAVERRIESLAARHLDGLIVGERHLERFVPRA